MRRVLRSFTEAAKEDALEAYRFELLLYVLQKPHDAKGHLRKPGLPGILKEVWPRE